MIIRHGEKPAKHQKGILSTGQKSLDSLTVRGWQRAGALAQIFSHSNGGIEPPTKLFACYKSKHAQRALDTITPLGELLGIHVNTDIPRDSEKEMARVAMNSEGIVLIAWEHKCIHKIANHIVDKRHVPQKWPNDRFDMIYVFDRQLNGEYVFYQVPQLALKGDSSTIFKI